MTEYLLFINCLGFILCLFDKFLAKKRKFRISEKILLGVCALGGVFGFFIGSRLVRHKTKDKKFLIFMYPIFVLWIMIILVIFYNVIWR